MILPKNLNRCKLIGLLLLLSILTVPVLAHGGAHEETQQDHGMFSDCLDSENCHMAADMMGYGWFGMGTWGFLIGITFWVVLILAIIYLLQRIMESREQEIED